MKESITVERVRHALVVGRLDEDGAAVLLAANLPPKRDRTYVVVGASSVDAMTRLDPWVIADLADEVRGDVCVVAPRFGSMGRDGTLPPARLLADRLGVEVTAADGDPVGLADGSVYVPGPTAGWVSYRPGGRRIRVGARFPAPWWQEGLPEPGEHLTHVPSGLWVRAPGGPDRPDDPLLRRVPDQDRMYVVLGAPGEQPPPATVVASVLRTLPDEGRDRAVLAWYGSAGTAGEVAAALGAPVRVAHGVPGDGGLVYVDETGAARWRPFAVESVYRPDGPPVLDRWVAPPRLAMVEPGSYRLTAGWRVDVVARGLVVRPESRRVNAAADTGPTADIVFATDGPVSGAVVAAFDALVRDLPGDTRQNLRILPVGDDAGEALTRIEAAAQVVAPVAAPPAPADAQQGPSGAVVVTADGRVLPAAPVLALPGPPVPVDIRDGVLTIPLEDDDPPDEIPAVAASTVAPTIVRTTPEWELPPALTGTIGAEPTVPPAAPAAGAPVAAHWPTGPVVPFEPLGATPVAASASGTIRPVGPFGPSLTGGPPSAAQSPVPPPAFRRVGAAGGAAMPAPQPSEPMEVAGSTVPLEPPAVPAASTTPAAAGQSARPMGPTGPMVPLAPFAATPAAPGASAVPASPAAPAPAAPAAPVGHAAPAPAASAASAVPIGPALPAASAQAPTPASPAPPAPVAPKPPAAASRSAMPVGPLAPSEPSAVAPAAPGASAVPASPAVPAPAAPAGHAAPAPAPAALAMPAAPAPTGPAMPVAPKPSAAASRSAMPVGPLAPSEPSAVAPAVSGAPAIPPAPAAPAPAPAAPAEPAAATATPLPPPPPNPPPPPKGNGLPPVAPTVSAVPIGSGGESITGLLPSRDLPGPIEVPENARSTAEQRRAMRGKLGARYDVATRAVTQLLSERPGLRFGTGDRSALLTELAVVRVFATDPDGEYDADFYTCLADGLRRLPTARTVVVRGIPGDTALRPEAVVRLPTPVVAAPVTAARTGPAEALIWTTTARRLDGLLDDHAGADVVLAGHTRLRVLAVEENRVLLAEDGTARDAALARLRAAAQARAELADETPVTRWYGPLPAA